MEKTIYLARHATPDRNRSDLIYHLPPGPPLTEQGKQEAQALGAYLLQAGVRSVYSSPLERCLQTAQIVTEMLKTPLQVIPELIEWQPGEPEEEVSQRVFSVLMQVIQADLPACIVTHGGPINALLGALGLPAEERQKLKIFAYGNLVPPAGAWKVSLPQADLAWTMHLDFKNSSETVLA